MLARSRVSGELQRYLDRATLGLAPELAEQVRDELEEHILECCARLEVQGLSPERALKQALHELGSPYRVSIGMNGVHNMKKLVGWAFTVTLVLGLGVYVLAQNMTTQVVPVYTQSAPLTLCAPEKSPALKMPIVSKKGGLICYKDEQITNPSSHLSSQLVESEVIKDILKAYGLNYKILDDRWLTVFNPDKGIDESYDYLELGGRRFSTLKDIFEAALANRPRDSRQTVKIALDQEQPYLMINNHAIKFATNQAEAMKYTLYFMVLDEVLSDLFPKEDNAKYDMVVEMAEGKTTAVGHKIKTNLKKGSVMALVGRKLGGAGGLFIGVGEVDSKGEVNILTTVSKIKFVSKASQLSQMSGDGRSPALIFMINDVPLNRIGREAFVPTLAMSDGEKDFSGRMSLIQKILEIDKR